MHKVLGLGIRSTKGPSLSSKEPCLGGGAGGMETTNLTVQKNDAK